MECKRVPKLPEGDDWLYQKKQDGYWVIGLLDGSTALRTPDNHLVGLLANDMLGTLNMRGKREVGRGRRSRHYISSTSIFFNIRSSFVMRNFRTCPRWISCGFEDSATVPLFQRAASIELSDAKSVFAPAE